MIGRAARPSPVRLTLVAEEELPGHLLADTEHALTHLGWLGLTRRSRDRAGLAVVDLAGHVPAVTLAHDEHDHEALRADLLAGWRAVGVAAAVVAPPLLDPAGAPAAPELLIMDCDSTLITAEVIERLAARAGVEEEVAAITTAAMRGELDFRASLARRVAMLAGVEDGVFREVAAEVEFSPGAQDLIDAVHAYGGRVGVVSGGFHEVVDALAGRLGIDHVLANRLEARGGRLTGRTVGPVIDSAAKAAALAQWSDGGSTVALGDGANDLEMLAAADLGIAYQAKPIVADQADAAIPFARLDAAREILGI